MKWLNRVKSKNPRNITPPKGIFLKIEEVEKSYLSKLKLKEGEHEELKRRELELEVEMRNVSQQAMATLRYVNEKLSSSTEEIEREYIVSNDKTVEAIRQSLKDQDFEIFIQKQNEYAQIAEQGAELRKLCDEIENHLIALNQIRSESEVIIGNMQTERDKTLEENALLQKNLQGLRDGHQHEIQRLVSEHQQAINQLNGRVTELSSGDDRVHVTKMRNDLLRKSQITFYTALIISLIGLGLTGAVITSIVQNESNRNLRSVETWEKIAALFASVATQGFGAAVYRAKRQCDQQMLDLSDKLEALNRERNINENIFKLLDMLKEPQLTEPVREQIQKCIDEMHLYRKS